MGAFWILNLEVQKSPHRRKLGQRKKQKALSAQLSAAHGAFSIQSVKLIVRGTVLILKHFCGQPYRVAPYRVATETVTRACRTFWGRGAVPQWFCFMR